MWSSSSHIINRTTLVQQQHQNVSMPRRHGHPYSYHDTIETRCQSFSSMKEEPLENKDVLLAISGSPIHDWPNHPETAERMVSIQGSLKKLFSENEGMHSRVYELTHLPPATKNDVVRIHHPRYLDLLEVKAKDTMDTSGMMIDESTYITRSSFLDALQSAGAVKGLVDAMMRVDHHHAECAKTAGYSVPKGFALCRPPGHHATRTQPMGFCLINNAAVAAEYLRSAYSLEKIAIIDFDVHHGNGTQDIFYSDPNVLFMSSHQDGSFPGTGKSTEMGLGHGLSTTINIPLPGDSGDFAARDVWEEVMGPALDRFQPDCIVVSAGYDAHLLDPLGGLQYTTSTYYQLTRYIVEASERLCKGRCIFVLEGGYHLDALGESVASSISAMLGGGGTMSLPSNGQDSGLYVRDEPRDKVRQVLHEVRSLHDLL